MSLVPPPDDRLSAYLDEELTAAERSEVVRLLAESEEWRAELAEVAGARNALRGARPHDAPPGFWEHLLAAGPTEVGARPWWRRGPLQVAAVAAAVAAAMVGAVAVPDERAEEPARPDALQADDEYDPGDDASPSDDEDEEEDEEDDDDDQDEDGDESLVERIVDAALDPFGW